MRRVVMLLGLFVLLFASGCYFNDEIAQIGNEASGPVIP